jgi:Zn-dependent protease with chaperone function
MPILVAAIIVLCFVLPAFVLFEPERSGETISFKIAVVVAIAIFGLSAAAFRVFGSWWKTRQLIAEWSRNAAEINVGPVAIPVFKLKHAFPVFAVVGVRRPKIFIAEQVLETLDDDEVSAVIQHELGHLRAWDNLKRIAMNLTSDLLVVPVGRSLQKSWNYNAEAAADEFAVRSGGGTTALDLAAALIKIARLIPDAPLPAMPAVSYVVKTDESLAGRVQRLLWLAEHEGSPSNSFTHISLPIFLGLLTLLATLLATDHAFLVKVHDISEAVLAMLE